MNNKNIRSVIAIGVIILLVVLVISIFVNRSYTGESTSGQTETQITEASPEPEEMPVYVFRNEKLLNEHYEKHGIEMGFASAEEYQAAASAVITNPDSLFKIEADDGDGVYYLEATNEFVVLSTDGYIRTYFLPSSGKAYFDRQ